MLLRVASEMSNVRYVGQYGGTGSGSSRSPGGQLRTARVKLRKVARPTDAARTRAAAHAPRRDRYTPPIPPAAAPPAGSCAPHTHPSRRATLKTCSLKKSFAVPIAFQWVKQTQILWSVINDNKNNFTFHILNK